jgi:hypothetical protein
MSSLIMCLLALLFFKPVRHVPARSVCHLCYKNSAQPVYNPDENDAAHRAYKTKKTIYLKLRRTISLRKTLTDWAELELNWQKSLVETLQTFVFDNERRAAKYSMTFAFCSTGYLFYMVSMSGLYPQWPYMVGLLVMRVSGREYLTQHLHTHVHIL